jgi:hypothetical protein
MPVIDNGAVFEPTRVRPARGPRMLAAVAGLAVVGLIAVGALDRQVTPSAESSAATPASKSSRPPPQASLGAQGIPNESVSDAVLELDVRPSGTDLFIHGDVFSLAVSRVSVTLEDPFGHVAAKTTLDVPGGSTAFRIGALPRFDVHFLLPQEIRHDGFVVLATALDGRGVELATLSQWVVQM